METCKNCGSGFTGKFCTECGQKKTDGRIFLKVIARDFVDKYWDFDAPFFKTVRELSRSPARMIRRYIRGQRKRYSHPIRYFIAALALFLIVKALIGFDLLEAMLNLSGAPSPMEAEGPESVKKSFNRYLIQPIYFFADNLNLFMLLFVFLFAGSSKVAFFKSDHTYAEYLALTFYVLGQYVLFSTFVLALVKADPRFYYLNFIFLFAYSIWVLVQFHRGSRTYRLLMSFYVVLISWLLYICAGFFISQFIVTTFGVYP